MACPVGYETNVQIFMICEYLFQAQALKMALEEKNISANVYVGMRYWYPFTEEAIQQVRSTLFFFSLAF